MNTRRIAVLLLATALYFSSLFAPVFQCHRQSPLGYEVLSYGMFGILMLDPRWYANIVFAVVLGKSVVMSSYRPSQRAAMVLVAACAATLLPVPGGCPAMDHMSPALGLQYGAFLWAASLCTLALLRLVPSALPKPNAA